MRIAYVAVDSVTEVLRSKIDTLYMRLYYAISAISKVCSLHILHLFPPVSIHSSSCKIAEKNGPAWKKHKL